jgi:hypothetical protein
VVTVAAVDTAAEAETIEIVAVAAAVTDRDTKLFDVRKTNLTLF